MTLLEKIENTQKITARGLFVTAIGVLIGFLWIEISNTENAWINHSWMITLGMGLVIISLFVECYRLQCQLSRKINNFS